MDFAFGPPNKPGAEGVLKEPEVKQDDFPTNVLTSFKCDQEAIRSARFNFDGNYCLTCGSDKTIKLWNPLKKLLIKKYTGHGYDVLDVVGSIDNCQLASCSSDKSVIYWDVASGQIVRRFRGHAGRVNCVAFNEESTVILSGSVDASIRCWDCRSKKHSPIQIIDDAKDSITSIQVNDHEILAGSIDGKIRRYDLRTGSLHSDIIGSAITCTKFSKDGQCILVSSHDSTIRLLDKSSGELLGEYQGHRNRDYTIECSLNKDDDHVISGSDDGYVYVWDLIEANIKHKLPIDPGRPVHSIATHPEKNLLLTASRNEIIVFSTDDVELPEDA